MEILRGKVALKKVGSIFEFSKKVMALWKEEKLMLKVIWMEPDRVEAAWCCRADEKPNNKIAILELLWQFWDKNVTWGKPGRVESRGLWPHPPQQPWSNNLIATKKRNIKVLHNWNKVRNIKVLHTWRFMMSVVAGLLSSPPLSTLWRESSIEEMPSWPGVVFSIWHNFCNF